MTTTSNVPGTRPGDVIGGKYRVEHLLGVGGMGVVVAARHIQLDEQVAIKLLLPEMMDVPGAVTRFSREARAAAKIRDEHVVRVTDVGQLENGMPYMVMEYLAGEDLAAWLSQRGALATDQAASLVLQACEALAAAHELGIVHRDLKPANLFITRRTNGSLSLKVLDFGISKMDADVAMTQTSVVMGSPLYMSPEQLRSSKDVDARADIWSIGVILYELLTGCAPFEGKTVAELVTQILTTEPPPATSRCPVLPVEMDAVISKCLRKERLERYQSVQELGVALAPFAASRESYAPPRDVTFASAVNTPAGGMTPRGGTTPLVEAAPTSTSWERANVTIFSKKSKVIMLAALSILAVAVLAVVGRLLVPATPQPSAIPAPSAPSNSNASSMVASVPSLPVAIPESTATPATSSKQTSGLRLAPEHTTAKKMTIPAASSTVPKVEPTGTPSVASASTPPKSHPFDDRK